MRVSGWPAGSLVLSILAASGARADDSTAGLASGGLTLTRSADVTMTSEDLYISPKSVRVNYVFLNTTGKDIAATMVFPMPDVTIDGPEEWPSIPKDSNNFLGFTTTVDGKAVVAQLQQSVFQGATDRTALLKSLGVPLAPFLAGDALMKLSAAQKAELEKLGLAEPFEYDEGKGPVNEEIATWTLKERYVWPIVFPAGKPVTVTHDYVPSMATFAGMRSTDPADAADHAKYCIDSEFFASVAKAQAPNSGVNFDEGHLSYILTTGANWKGPIGVFHLTVDKGVAANLVSFCGTGVAKSGPTSFSVTYKNYTPTRNIDVLLALAPGQD
jgi:hypothetical protein